MKKKLWIDLFIKVGVIFVVFVVVLGVANSTLLLKYFTIKQEKLLREQAETVAAIDPYDTDALDDAVWGMREAHNFDTEIYFENGKIIYTTRGAQLIDFRDEPQQGPGGFKMIHEIMKEKSSKTLSDGTVILTAVSAITGDEYLVCRRISEDGIITELRTKTSILENSASVAGEFMTIVAALCFAISLIWVFMFAKKFASPIAEMNEITKSMARLDFSRKVKVTRQDELGQLGESVNVLSNRLDEALTELRDANARLRDEIELERQLDVMRRGFVANVSHELKTPLAIIGGYAEGLKLGVNGEAREEYCDTIIDETERMNRLVLSLLELSKYEGAQMPTSPAEFDISVMAKDMLERIFRGKEEVTLSCEIPEGTAVFADAVQTEQILKSYLENAAAHVKNGGIVRIFCEEAEDGFKVCVFNSGEHIDPELMPQIWQSFFRGDKAHSRSEGRFGLGLSIVAAIVKAQGETCGVDNVEDGVCFWFTVKRKNEQCD